MAAVRAKLHSNAQASFLERLAVVFADPLRLKIVTELYMREMSPTQFYEAFGGGSVARVDRHFKKLVEHAWLRLVRTVTGGRRRGGTEHFYRATELAVFDLETWAQLPYSIKVAFSHQSFEQFAERVKDALEAGTFDARLDRHFTWTPVLLDQEGWVRVISRVDALFESLLEEQADVKLRIARSTEAPILTTVGLAAFESPMRGRRADYKEANLIEPLPVTDQRSLDMPFTTRLAKVFADPLNLKIVTELNLREMSPTQFHEEFGGGSVSALDRRFKALTNTAWLIKTGEKTGGKRRGAIEHFYRAIGPAIFDSSSWSTVPNPIKATFSWRTFELLVAQVKEAMDAGTFDARPERHLTWSLLMLDRLGWEQTIAAVDEMFGSLFLEQKEAKARLAESGERPMRATIALAAFESPKDRLKAP